ncbi:MAG TPA: hypothetical protein VL981_01390 [Candidatus Methylacidiphilales bacterium]|nr:hypothetical protein [Candidatus Methylacidiphilales bacterium]
MASAVVLTLSDAKQTGLSSSGALLLLPIKNLISFHFNRSEQKAPHDLGPIRITDPTTGIRSLFTDGSRFIDGAQCFQYVLGSPAWAKPFCLRLNSFESPRAPPWVALFMFC